ncbi:MAG: hypothetical protein QOI25_562 [Mycobacterium sp.]|nr:hypothetical protein [Mycobacterium sp.]
MSSRLGQSVRTDTIRLRPRPTQQDPVAPMPPVIELFSGEGGDIALVHHQPVTVRALQSRGEGKPTRRECAVTEADRVEQLHEISHYAAVATIGAILPTTSVFCSNA